MAKEIECWLSIKGFGGRYEVSSFGRVRNAKGRILCLRKKSNGYLQVSLSINGVTRYLYVSRLVCDAFIGPAPNIDSHADHINRRRDFNYASNLRWLSPEENRSFRICAAGVDRPEAKLSEDNVRLIRSSSHSNRILAEEFGVVHQTIAKIKNRERWKHVI